MLGHVADVLPEIGTIAGDVVSHDGTGAIGRLNQAEKELDEGGLACTVGADEADDPRLQFEIEGIESGDRSVPLGQAAGLY